MEFDIKDRIKFVFNNNSLFYNLRTMFASEIAANGKVMGAADFVAGFVFGMTADNHLTEVETCFTGGELMYHEVETGIADIKTGGWNEDVQAALEFGLVALQVPAALKTCKGMTDDVNAIEQWAAIFKNPTELAKTVSKHYLFHKTEIKADIASLESDWSAKMEFKAGKDLADLLTLAVGPIEVNEANLPPVAAVPDFTSGLIYGFTGNDHRAELDGCMTDISPLVNDAKDALSNIVHLNVIKAVQDLADIIWMLPDAVSSCGELEDLTTDLDVMLAWADMIKSNPASAAKVASKNWLFHGVKIKKDIATEEADWTSGDYYGSGQETAAVMTILVPQGSITSDASAVMEYILN